MEYNKNQFHKMNDRKILHKIGKHWVTVSLSTLMAIGGIAFAQHTATANADPVNDGQSNFKVNSAQSSLNSTLQSSSENLSNRSQNSAKSTSQDADTINQRANQLHTRILNNSIHQIKPSAVNSSSQQNSANYSGTITESPTVLKDSKTTNNSITVQYLDQHNHKVGGGIINGKPAHSTVDVISPNDGGIAIPNGYSLDNNEDPNFVFSQQPQTATLGVHGNNANSVVKIRRVEKHLNGSTTSDVQSDNVSGVIGSDIDIQPHDYVPKNGVSPSDVYYIAPSDHSHFVTLHAGDQTHPTAYVTPNEITFDYNEEKRSPNKLGTIMVHYQDYNTPGVDISKIPVNGEIGNDVDMNSYRTNVPQAYYYVKTQKAAKTFQNVPQDVVVYVKQLYDVRAKLYFENIKNNNQVVGSHDLVGSHEGAKIPYDSIINSSWMPKGYRYVSMGKYDSVLHNGDTNIIYVEPGNQPTPTEDGSVIVNYYLNGNRNDLVKSESDRKTIGSPFSTSHYIAHPPVGYHVIKVLDGQNIQSFEKTLQNLDIDVASNKPSKPSDKPSQQASVNIDYLDNSNPKDVVKTISDVKGTAGSAIDFTPFETSPNLPSGYTFNRVGNQNAVYKNGDVEDIYVNKKSPQEATVYIDYKDYTDPSTVLKTVSDSGMPNQQIDYTKYEKAPYLPKNYSFLTLGSTDSTFVNGDHETILVKANQTPTPPASKQAIGTLLYKDDQSGDVEGRTTIKGNQDDPINYGEYTNNGSQYMPNGYHFDKIADGSGQYLEPNATYTIMISKNGSDHPKDVKGTMYYLDNNTGKSVGTAPINGQAGEIIPYTQYESSSNLPKGYHFDRIGPDSGTKLESGGSYTIIVDKDVQQITDNVIYKNISDGSSVGTAKITGQQGQNANLAGYEDDNSADMPAGFQFDHAGSSNPAKLLPNTDYFIYVKKSAKPVQDVTAYVVFHNTKNDSDMQVISDTAKPGTTINYNDYINRFKANHTLPNGYYDIRVANNAGQTVQSNARNIVYVTPMMNSDSNKEYTAHIIFRNTQNNDTMQTVSDTDKPGTTIDYQNYINQFVASHPYPNGHYDVTEANGDDSVIPNRDANEIINVTPVANKVQNVTAYIVFHNMKTNQDMQTMSDTAKPGTMIDYNDYINRFKAGHTIPNGYYDAQLSNNASQTVQSGAQNVVDVTPMINSDSNKEYTAHIIFRNTQNNDQMQTISDTAKPGSTIDYQNYINQFLANHQYPNGHYNVTEANGDDSVIPNHDANETINVTPVKDTISGTLYYRNGNQTLKNVPISGIKGTPVNYNQFEQTNEIPNGYHVAGLAQNASTTFEPNGNYVIMLKANPNVSGTIFYFDAANGAQAGTAPISGPQGGIINFQPYEANNSQYMPKGYHFDKVSPGTGNVLEPGRGYAILVDKNAQQITDHVIYRDASNGNQLSTAPISGLAGSAVNLVGYEANSSLAMPKGYQFDYADSKNPSTLMPDTNYTLFVKKSAPQMIQATLNYVNPLNHQVVKSTPISGTEGSNVDYGNYMASNQLPSGYKLAGISSTSNQKFEPNGNYTLLVEPVNNNNNNQSQTVKGTLNYKDNDGNTIKSVPISGIKGSNVNYDYYMQANQMPQGYHLVGLGNGTSATFEPNGSYSIVVAANPANHTPSNPTHHNSSNNNGDNNGNNGDNTDNNGNGDNTNNNGNGDNNSGNSGNTNNGNNGNGSNQPIFTDRNSTSNNGSNQNNGNLPRTGEHHYNYDRQISEILIMMGISLASLGRCIRRRYYN